MAECTRLPHVRDYHADQIVHVKREETGDTVWQQEGQENVLSVTCTEQSSQGSANNTSSEWETMHTCVPPVRECNADQTVDTTHIKKEETGDTGWQQEQDNVLSGTCAGQSSQGSANNTSSESSRRHADRPLIMRVAAPIRSDMDEKLTRVFRQEKEVNGILCSAVEFWMDTNQTKFLIQVELGKNNGHGHYKCPWPSCWYGRKARHHVADHIRKVHMGPNFCPECGHMTKSLGAIHKHRKRTGHNTGPSPLFSIYQLAAIKSYSREVCSEFGVYLSEVQ
ncbi:uncharacterized protein LOC118403665 [Branchiostoma floridae]|uniref:Uncharacterized protein LOC118403665 n=1 Tax=Branchiostoma floridae TaxID=7739 RepID=A0A9J7HF56_BRAFL|nr:uncharacterized protein LOC118403665 [Branchiostoma floridae]